MRSVQLRTLNLSSNALEGSLPETWGSLTSVSLYFDSISDQCEH